MADIKRSLLFDTYNGYLKTLNKLESVFVAKIENVGTVLVKAETYHYWQSGDAARKHIVFVRFTAMPHKARLGSHKLVLRDVDIRAILGVEIFELMGDEKALIALYARLFGQVRLEINSQFRYLCFPLSAVDKTAAYAHLHVAKNEAGRSLFEEGEAFLTPKACAKAVVCKVVIKIQGKFAVVSVLKDLQTKLLSLEFYFPQLMRTLNTSLFASNKSNRFKQKIVQNVEKLLMKRLENWHSAFVDVSKIHDVNQSLLLDERFPRRRLTMRIEEVGDYQAYVAKIFGLLEDENRGHSFSGLNKTEVFNLNNLSLNLDDANVSTRDLNDMSVITEANSQRFKNQLYWDILARAVVVNPRPRGKLILQVGNCRNIFKETAFSKDAMIGKQFFRFEVVVEKTKSSNVLQTFKPEMFQNLKGVYYYLKVTNFTAGFERNSKLTLLKALELLNIEFSREYVVNIQVIRHIAFLTCRQMFFGIRDFLQKKENKAEQTKGFKQPLTYFIDKTKPIATTMHTRLCELVKISETDPYELLHKTVFMREPLVTLEIHMSHEKAEVIFLMYNVELRSLVFEIKPVRTILASIPFFGQLLALGDKVNLGRRLEQTFKNMLIIKYINARRIQSVQDLNMTRGELPQSKAYQVPAYASPKLHFFPPEVQTDSLLDDDPTLLRRKKPARSQKSKVVTISHV
jgi:hypothetical protein